MKMNESAFPKTGLLVVFSGCCFLFSITVTRIVPDSHGIPFFRKNDRLSVLAINLLSDKYKLTRLIGKKKINMVPPI